ncbi:MAG: ATP-dependent RNA helicase, partial [Acidobacteria bacterium]|nr:ATP-dependent RNA helicase [Acidobacteriota bacterium]
AEWGAELGREIGYQVRFEKHWGDASRIVAVTDGVLLRLLQADPFLDGIAAVVFDEFHERRLESDLAFAMARRVQREVRGDLHLVVMSATLESEPVARFLGDCPVLESEGRRFPVEVSYLDDGAPLREPPPTHPAEIVRAAARAVPRFFEDAGSQDAGGDLLAFLPGVGEIRRTQELLTEWAAREGVLLMPLYGDLDAESQDAALRPQGQPRVVLATNVAESSVTVDGIVGVIDSGWARVLRYDPGRGLDRLELARISQASADQRAGRAGRQRPGRCLRLWPRGDHRVAWDTPDVRRVDPAAAVLQLAAWGETDAAAFPWFEAPEKAALATAAELLEFLGALDASGAITATGRAMAGIPAQPRAARLLVEAHQRGLAARGAVMAALLTERWPFRREPRQTAPGADLRSPGGAASDSDLLDAVEALE